VREATTEEITKIKMAVDQERCRANVRNWRAKTDDAKLRRFYESLDCARLFNTRYQLDYAGVDLKGARGRLAMSIVCNIGDEKMKSRKILFDWLLREKCDFNLQDDEGLTLINWLCKNNRMELFEFLVNKHSMDINYVKTDDNGDAPLTHAVRMGNLELVQRLIKIHLKFGLSVDLQNREGLSPYAEAIKLNFTDIAELLKTEGKASTNIYVEPLWSLQSFEHSFKDVLSASQKSERGDFEKKSTEKDLRKIKKKATGDSKNSRRKSLSKQNIRQNKLSESTTVTRPPRKISVKGSTSNGDSDNKATKKTKQLQRRSGIIRIEPSPKLPKRKFSTRNSTQTFERIDECPKPAQKDVGNHDNEGELVDTLSKVCLNGSQNKTSNQSTETQNISDTTTIGTTKLKLTNNYDTPLGSRMRKTSKQPKPLRRKSLSNNLRMSGAASPTPSDGVEARLMAEEYRMNELMQYRSQPRNSNEKITYHDVSNFYPTMQRVGSASTTTEQLRWLLRLKMDQREIHPASSSARHLNKNEVCKLIPDRAKQRKFAILPLMSQEKTEMLCNAVFNRILNSPM